MIIGIVPTIREVYKKQFELSIDQKLIIFFKKIYKKCEFKILFQPNLGGREYRNPTSRGVRFENAKFFLRYLH